MTETMITNTGIYYEAREYKQITALVFEMECRHSISPNNQFQGCERRANKTNDLK